MFRAVDVTCFKPKEFTFMSNGQDSEQSITITCCPKFLWLINCTEKSIGSPEIPTTYQVIFCAAVLSPEQILSVKHF